MLTHLLAHLVRPTGKGRWVFALPFIISFILFVLFSVLELDDQYIGGMTMLISCLILLKMEDKPEEIHEGVIRRRGRRSTGKNTFAYIEMRYWAVLFGIIGLALLLKDHF